MTERSRLVQSTAAGLGVFVVCVWPVVLIWRAGRSGSVGDVAELRLLGIGLVYSVVLAVLAGRSMHRALTAPRAPGSGRLDPWGAYALGVGVFVLALTAVPAVVWVLLVADEHQSLRSREWRIVAVWVVGHLGAAGLGVAAARTLLRPSRPKP